MSDNPTGEVQIFVNDKPFWVQPDFQNLPAAEQQKAANQMYQQAYGDGFVTFADDQTPPEPAPSLPLGKRVSQVTSGANQELANLIGAPGDLVAGFWNHGVLPDVNAFTRHTGLGQVWDRLTGWGDQMSPIVDPIYGSAGVTKGFQKLGLIGDTPAENDTLGQYLWAGGAGAMGAAESLVGGKALSTAARATRGPQIVGRVEGEEAANALASRRQGGVANTGLQPSQMAEKIGDTLAYGSDSKLGTAANVASGVTGGVGAEAATKLVSQSTDNPVLKAGGALLGGVIGGMTPMALGASLRNANNIRQQLTLPRTLEGQQTLADRALKESAFSDVHYGPDEKSPLVSGPLDRPGEGSMYTMGQLRNDPALLDLERTVEAQLPSVDKAQFDLQRSNANQTILGHLDTLGLEPNVGAPGAGGQIARSQSLNRELVANEAAARQAEHTAWKAIDPNNEVRVPMDGMRQNYEGAVNALGRARGDLVPAWLERWMAQSGPDETLNELMNMRSRLRGEISQAVQAGDRNLASALGDIDRAVYQRLPDGSLDFNLPANASQAAQQRYQRAQQISRDFHATFSDGDFGKLFETTRGQPSVHASVTGEHILQNATVEQANQFVKAANANPETAARTLQTGREWFISHLVDSVSGAKQDLQGAQTLLGNKLRNFVNNNQGVLQSDLFTKEQRDLINQTVEAAQMVERTGRAGQPGTSNTARLITGGNYIRDTVGGTFGVVGRLIGTVAGAHVAGVPGALYGLIKTSPAVRAAYDEYTQNVMRMMARGLRDPEEGARMIGRATDAPERSQYLPRVAQTLAPAGSVAGAATATTDRSAPVYDLAAEAVTRLGPGERVSNNMLRRATGINDIVRIREIRDELINKGVINRESEGVYRRSTPASPNKGGGGPRSEAEPHPLEEPAYKAAQNAMPTLRRSTFNEVAGDITGRPSPLHGQLAPGGLFEQLANGHATHETVELAARTRAIAPGDWRILQSKANNWANKFDLPEDLPASTRRHEAIATAYNLWNNGEMQMPPGLRRIFGDYRSFSEVA